MKSFFQKNLKFIFIFLVSLGLAAGVLKTIIGKKQQSLPFNLKKAQTAMVTRGNLEKELTLAGKIDAQNFAVLHFQTSGRLIWVGVKEGERVKKGQTIASLDKTELEKNFRKTMNDYLTNRWNFEDTQDQYHSTKEKALVTDEIKRILERKQFSLENAVWDVEIADLALKYATLVSPINGFATQVEPPSAGVNITPQSATFTIIDPDSLYFKSEIDEEDVVGIEEGQSATITLDTYLKEDIPGEITYIGFTPIEGQTATVYKIKFSLYLKKENLCRIGMNGDAKIALAEVKNVLLLPNGAIFEEKGEKIVYLKIGKKIEKTIIQTGLEGDEEIEIKSGLKEGDQVFFED